MAELETAERFWGRLDGEIEQSEGGGVYLGGHALALIEDRDKAVALRVLDELIALDDDSEDPLSVYRAVPILRAKYQEKP